MRAFFLFFLGSGFASLVYEVVWLRLAMASFGVTTPLVSIVLSVFMAGLALGSLAGGRLARRLATGPRRALAWYAVTEAAIAVFALFVPPLFQVGRTLLTSGDAAVAWDSATYYLASGAWIALAMLPACTAMGATFPLAMAAIRARVPAESRSFSFLYLANVLGATTGTLAAAFVLIELLGLRATLTVAVAINLAVAAGAFVRSRQVEPAPAVPAAAAHAADPRPAATVLLGLFLTGLVSMAMELVWIRQFTPYVGNLVYAFALILGTYLAATFLGSHAYRAWIGPETSVRAAPFAWLVAGLAGLLPLAAADPRLALPDLVRLVAGVAPLSAAAGLITPMLVDRWSGGDAKRAGAAYATNVVGSIAGPLVAAFWLLPWLGEHRALTVLSVPLFVVGALAMTRPALLGASARPSRRQLALVPVVAALALVLVAGTRTYETLYPERHV
ncbi:MAG: fused MFS/spermidine synthase, partial [Candidatus Rokubacteria bacterium]|nr:fused MFS/spermidine synthase [Candidatus Rokubacteria bacterium]